MGGTAILHLFPHTDKSFSRKYSPSNDLPSLLFNVGAPGILVALMTSPLPLNGGQVSTVFVVEDHPGLRKLLWQVFRRLGHDARAFADGEDVLDELMRPNSL